MSDTPMQRGPNYNWEHEVKHYQKECDDLRELLRSVEQSSDKLVWGLRRENTACMVHIEFLKAALVKARTALTTDLRLSSRLSDEINHALTMYTDKSRQ